MQARRLSAGGTIGIVCPSHVAREEQYARIASNLERLGFRVKLGPNIYQSTYGFVASPEERAADINAFVADDEVELILFGGGDGAAEVLPLLDYEAIRKHPKLFSSYSDGTSILNAVHAQTGLTTYYGLGAGEFEDLRYYNYRQFCARFVQGHEAEGFEKGGEWITLRGGRCEGTLIGGYAPYFGLMLSNRYFRFDPEERYLLFLEDNEKYTAVETLCTYLAFLEQSALMRRVTGLIFGHYADALPNELRRRLEGIGERCGIPVVYTDDFGHGVRHAILPIGLRAELDADRQSLRLSN
ncbi:MAG: LD-carboxypeptidase [Eubacteriales bacterium]|nr:LD-carboxypeptidase [Eubacteriales bacterium]